MWGSFGSCILTENKVVKQHIVLWRVREANE